ncbi:maltose/maltodextrin ABC transporter ATP-binding protein MalK [Ursidibacter maritimus]|uniref:Maltose/maltodextrin ABC transporter ATP-binding protein MalK n=1 Tax=Ursidibacter maritimus TaxID=1331689 RepID=A0A949SXJ1_9PAST|nr:maltose/maltodextrin ABC transporter ATP-binding protein MalK [Ursidibacter maritimus]KAE9542038.1 maltose/maltodextrin transporter ATP-binding protein [Ursidibacter maritimus]MBV6523158.1 maltose/maltodextrin ABC transporter ATP-binding protein MalK [Ursidibacter maritimus]MBV6525400.1 maltose/maltodextrin ABC transporter ATP-binding protein MalK [Ursidibacter maritimus]MBV6527490.1 maltose/maltodextrin ABC transporter ATP-binding protein MalK [Ursidibacter maritimus]MBV6529279.1 maltose/m
MANVRLVSVGKSYGDIHISKDVNLDIKEGEFVVFVGPSGCGKSTLLRMIAGLEDITTGDLYIGETRMNDVPPAKRNIGMVFQSYALYPHLNVAENMSFGLKLAGKQQAEIEQRVNQVAEILQLAHLLQRKPKELSGGQRQRVAIGRTLVSQPEVFLLDEPLSNLDAALRVQMRVEISKLHKKLGRTMIYVTHDQVEAMTLADKIVVLQALGNNTQITTNVAQIGKPLELYHYPANRFVAGFIGSPKMNFLPVKVIDTKADGVKIELPDSTHLNFWIPVDSTGVKVGDNLSLGIRPEHLLPCDQSEVCITGTVKVVEQLGNETQVHVEMPPIKQSLVYRQNDIVLVEEGDQMSIGINPNRCHLFKEDGTACKRLFKELGV